MKNTVYNKKFGQEEPRGHGFPTRDYNVVPPTEANG
jgi:hypothetical protein